MNKITPPHGNQLIDLYMAPESIPEYRESSKDNIDLVLSKRQLCDTESLLNGAFSPLKGFLNKEDYASVVKDMTLSDGTLWPVPVVLDVSAEFAGKIEPGCEITLLDHENALVANMVIDDIWQPDKQLEAKLVFGTNNTNHPGVTQLLHHTEQFYLGGRLTGIEPPVHYDFIQHRYSPSRLRKEIQRRRWTKIIAFQTGNPLHQAQVELISAISKREEANVIINPALCEDDPETIDNFSKIRCCEEVMSYFPEQTTLLAVTTLATRYAGPREVLWHAIIKQNYGFTHMIAGAGHAGVKLSNGELAYAKDASWKLYQKHKNKLEIKIIQAPEMVYNSDKSMYMFVEDVKTGETVLRMDNKTFYTRLSDGLEIPSWFSFPEVIARITQAYPPKQKRGFTVFFTGLSGSGKSTLAKALTVKMQESGSRSVTLLDGDEVRQNLSSELGFSKAHRNLNIIRIGYVASEITKAGGIAICAPIAPYSDTRSTVGGMIRKYGGFIEIHVSTPLETCEARDRKGLYAKARQGIIKEFTGISDPYEEPIKPELRIDTTDISAPEAVNSIILKLEHLGYI